MLAARADVARDLRQLVGGDEDTVVALVFEVQVVACDVSDGAGLKAREARDPVVLVHDDVAGAQLGERAQRAAARRADSAVGALGAAPAQETVLGKDRERVLRRDEALTQRGCREPKGCLDGLAGRDVALAQPPGFHASEVVGRALPLPPAREAHDGPVARTDELLELWLRFGERACGGVRGLGAQLDRLPGRERRQPDPRAHGERRIDAVGADVEVVRVLVGERRADIRPVVGQDGLEFLLGGHHHLRAVSDEVEQCAEALDREQVGDVRALGVRAAEGTGRRRGLRELAVLGGELGGWSDLDLLDLAERALCEGREPPQRFDLDIEHVHPHGAVLR